jgi:predicted transcriptional regulator of viral defense system
MLQKMKPGQLYTTADLLAFMPKSYHADSIRELLSYLVLKGKLERTFRGVYCREKST